MTDPFDDDPLVRALRGPGTPGETADEDRYRAMFRETRGTAKVLPLGPGGPRRPGGRAARRFGAGTTLSIVIAAAASSGVAAAYTNHLPEPIQTFAHEMGRTVGVPSVEERPQQEEDTTEVEQQPMVTPTPNPSEATAAAEPTPTADPSEDGEDKPNQQGEPTGRPSEEPSASATPSPSASPTATTSASQTPSPSPAPTPSPSPSPSFEPPAAPAAASVSISGSSRTAGYGASPTFSGVVRTEDGTAVSGVRVRLLARTDGTWSQVGFATTDTDGVVHMTAPPVYETVGLRFKTKGARSEAWRVAMVPTLDLSSSVDGDTVTITASALGGQEGDVVRLNTRRDGRTVLLATGIIGPGGSVTFQVEQQTRKARYGALLERTDDHAADRAAIVVVKPTTPKNGDGEPGEPGPSQPAP